MSDTPSLSILCAIDKTESLGPMGMTRAESTDLKEREKTCQVFDEKYLQYR